MEEKKSILFIVNPISGTANKELILNDIEERLDKNRFNYAIAKTAYSGHGAVLASMAAENGTDIVVAIGGDGTVNEVARSLVHTNTALGIIPCGSGNGLARHLQIPLEYSKAIQLINECSIHPLDYGKINGRPFFCTCGMGFDATISYKFAASIRRGILTYMENSLKEITRYKPETYTLEDETNKFTGKAFLITCANASQYGNNAYIAPEASMSDGLMDITFIEPFTALEAPGLAYQLFNGTLSNNSKIHMFRSRLIHITREHAGVIHCDGDPFMADQTVTIEIFPHQLNTIINCHAEIKPSNFLQTIAESFSYLVNTGNNAIGHGIKQINKDIRKKIPFKL
ncbi:MAG: YegS/Rv2252/BmrU family lipid kinase [Bacteroidaceae bacterium]|jgi:YegS/Rv2252/BmrU family lipid kinase|nr:YegS/Rv2252/BmrU family lipid kinase [Bacteroidaceae bacterium]